MASTKDKKILLKIRNLKQYFPLKKASIFQKEQLFVRANDDVSIDIYEGETFGLVGESGCGKSTLGRTLLQLYSQTDGRTMYYGRDRDDLAPKYVLQGLKSLSKDRERLNQALAKEKEVRKEMEAAAEGSAKYNAIEKHRIAEKEARDIRINMSQLIGGMMLADNLDSVAENFIKEYESLVALRKLKNKLNSVEVKINAIESAGKTEKLEPLKVKQKELKGLIAAQEAVVEEVKSQIEKMLDKYRDKPDFEMYESFRDGGIDLARLKYNEMVVLRKDLSLIFQDPYSSLNPRLTVGQIVSEGLFAHKMYSKSDKNVQDYLLDTMEKCGLAKYFVHRYPHQFSGGQRQRIGIARSVALKPKFIVCDEAVSALDVSIQSQIINLLLDLKEQEKLTYMFISHDLSVIKYISDRVGVMYLGNMVELADTQELFARPMHPYTEALLNAIPTTDDNTRGIGDILEGDIPSPIRPPSGCKFHTRCKYVTDICKKLAPEFEEVVPGHFVACHHKLNQENI